MNETGEKEQAKRKGRPDGDRPFAKPWPVDRSCRPIGQEAVDQPLTAPETRPETIHFWQTR